MGGSSSKTIPPAGSQAPSIVPTTELDLSDVFTEAGQSTILEVDDLALVSDQRAAFYDPATNKFYKKMKVTPDSSLTYPKIWDISLMKKKQDAMIVGHEQNNSGTQFTLTTPGSVWFGGSNCDVTHLIAGSCGRGQVLIPKQPGTYTCSTTGLGVADPAYGAPKHCILVIPMDIYKVVSLPDNCNVEFLEQVLAY